MAVAQGLDIFFRPSLGAPMPGPLHFSEKSQGKEAVGQAQGRAFDCEELAQVPAYSIHIHGGESTIPIHIKQGNKFSPVHCEF